MQGDPSTHSPGPPSLTPSIGEIDIPPPPASDIEEMLPVGFSELDAIAASPVLDVELLPPPSTDSDSADSSYLHAPPLDGPAGTTRTTDSTTLPERTTPTSTDLLQHDLTTFDLEKGFWGVYHGARELLRYATIYQEHRDSMMRSHPAEDHRNKPLITIPREIDLESMTQLSWGVTRAVADINAYDRCMHMLSGRNSRLASPRPEGHHHHQESSSKRISKRNKKQRRAPSRVSGKQQQEQQQQQEIAAADRDTDTPMQYKVCKARGTFHSPQWRYGPEGLRNLCNVCGLLHAKKTQRRMLELERDQERRSNAAASAGGGGV